MSVEWHKLGEFIEDYDERNSSNIFDAGSVRGVNISKSFMPTAANLDGVDLRKYKLVHPECFVFSGMQTGRDECIRIAYNDSDVPFVISPAYFTFRIAKEGLVPEYLYMLFLRKEMDRLGWFLSDSSVRANLDWKPFLNIEIPVPSIEEQKKVVEVWQRLRKMKEENEKLAEPLMQLCRSYLQDCKKKYEMVELGGIIAEENKRNVQGECTADDVRGLSTNKELIDTAANLNGVNLDSYKIVSPGRFAYVSDTSRRGDKMSLGYNQTNETFIVSSISTVFSVDFQKLNPTFLYLWFCRPEFDRYARFNSWGSARETFNWSDMCRVKIPLPPIDVQQAIVDVYRCANEAKKIAAEADRLSREICPALVRYAAERAGI